MFEATSRRRRNYYYQSLGKADNHPISSSREPLIENDESTLYAINYLRKY